MNPKISVVILNLEQPKMTTECIESICNNDYIDYEIILVDNGSSDDSVDILKNFIKKNKKIRLIENKENLGFTGGNNVGIRNSDGDYVLLLNNDTITKKDFLSTLAKATNKFPLAGAFTPRIYSYNNPSEIVHIGGKITRFLDFPCMPLTNKDNYTSVDWISGCALMIKREALNKVGLLNSSFFLYWEDAEWSLRAKKAGYDLIYVPDSEIWHKGSITSKAQGGSPIYIYFGYRNKLLVFKNQLTGTMANIIYIETIIALIIRGTISLLKGNRINGMAYFYALSDSIRGDMKKRYVK